MKKITEKILFLIAGVTLSLFLTGCGHRQLEKENQQLKRQLELSKAAEDETGKELKEALSKVEAQEHRLEEQTNTISNVKEKNEKLEKDLEIYRGKANEAIGDVKALESILDDKNIETENFVREYINTKMNIEKIISSMPESPITTNILSILNDYGDIETLFEDADNQIKEAQEIENNSYQNDLMLSHNDYESAWQKFNHSNNLAKRRYFIMTNRAKAIGAKEIIIGIKLINIQNLIDSANS